MLHLLRAIVRTGLASGLASGVAALALSRRENRRAGPAMNALSHIAWGGAPPAHAGRYGRNFVVGWLVHIGASVFWASFFEALFGRAARSSAAAASLAAGATATAAYLTDYRVVPPRLRPGMESFLSRPAVIAVYAALAAGFLLAARSEPVSARGAGERAQLRAAATRGP